MTTNEVVTLKFKLTFLRAMLPVMTLEDVIAYTECAQSFLKGNVSLEQFKKVNELIDKFSSHRSI